MSETTLPIIRFATPHDLTAIQAIYAQAREVQRSRSEDCWPAFPAESVLDEIDRRQLLCVMENDTIAAVFSIAYDDALWGDRDRGEHVYLHRIAKSAHSRITDLLDPVLAWTRAHCRDVHRTGLRMDTWARNTALIALYERRGFRVLDRIHVGHDPRLAPHYQATDFVLLEERR